MNLFLYGTLRHPRLLDLIGGPGPAVAEPASLPGYAVDRDRDSPLPMIVQRDGAKAEGLLLRGLSAVQLDRLDAYELPFGYVRSPVTVRTSAGDLPAEVYLPPVAQAASGDPWSIDDWFAEDGEVTLYAAEEIAAHDPPLSGEDLARQWGMIRMRAHARARAAANAAPATHRRTSSPDDARVLSATPPAGGFYKFRQATLSHDRFDGSDSGPLPREVFHAVDAALVLPYDPARGLVLLVEQFRVGPFMRGDANPWVLEPVAGIVDAGETPAAAARREAEEEAALGQITLHHMFDYYASPGGSTDYFYCYAGVADLGGAQQYSGGLEEEAEDLRLHILPLAEALALIDTGEVNAGPLISMLYWLDRNKDRLTAAPA